MRLVSDATSIFKRSLALALSLMLASSAPVSAIDSKWSIENILSARDIEVVVDSSLLDKIESLTLDKQQAEISLRQGDYADAAVEFEKAIAGLKKVLPLTDARIQSARYALAEALLMNRKSGACLSNLKVVLQQELNKDKTFDLKLREWLSADDLRKEDVESAEQFEERYRSLRLDCTKDVPSAVVYRARILFFSGRLADALRLTRIALALEQSAKDVPAKQAASRLAVRQEVRREALYLQCLVHFRTDKLEDLRESKKRLGETLTAPLDAKWQARTDLIAGLEADLQGNHKEAIKIYKEALELARKDKKDRYDEFMIRIYLGHSLFADGRTKDAYFDMNSVFEDSRRLIEGRRQALVFHALEWYCRDELYRCVAKRLNSEFDLENCCTAGGGDRDLRFGFFPRICNDDSEADRPGLPSGALAKANQCSLFDWMAISEKEQYSKNLFVEKPDWCAENYHDLASALGHVGYQHKTHGFPGRAQILFWNCAYVNDTYEPANRSDLAGSLYDLAESYSWAELKDVAVMIFKKCAAIRGREDPDSDRYIMTLDTMGRAYMAQGKTRDAIECMKTALHHKLHMEKSQAHRIERFVREVKTKRDADDFRRAPRLVSTRERLRETDVIGAEKFSQQLRSMPLPQQLDTVEEYRADSDPDKSTQIDDLWQVLADTYSNDRSFDEAIEISRRLLELRRKSPATASRILDSLWQLAWICSMSDNQKDALVYYTDMIQHHAKGPGKPLADWYYSRGVVNDTLGDVPAAKSDFKKAIIEFKKQLKKCDRIKDKEEIDHLGWTIYDLEQELRVKEKSPPEGADYVRAYPCKPWAASRFPLKVCIDQTEKHGFGPGLYPYMKRSVEEWKKTKGMEDKIVFVDDREKADIYFERVSNYDLIPWGSGGGAVASYVMKNGKPTDEKDRVHLRLYCSEYDADKMSKYSINGLYNLALHEFGHGIGLGHSPNGLDIMYWKSAMKQVSDRDRATLQKIYGCKVKKPE